MKPNAHSLSVVVLAKNEEQRIADCLSHLQFADEVIVVDNGSVDATCAIAKKYKARVIHESSLDFSFLRDSGKKASTGEWILYVDADEIVPDVLAKEIAHVISAPIIHEGYFIKRNNSYLGHQWPVGDCMQRLFVASKLVGWRGKLHETAIIHGTFGILQNSLIHITHRTISEMVEKTNQWSFIEAELRYEQHHPIIVPWRLMRVMGTGFWQAFIHEGGWKAGTAGWIESMYQSFSMFITYAKLWELQQKHHE